MKEIIRRAFKATVQSYEHILQNYYPAHGSNGFTERNLTFNFSHNYLLENRNAIIWQECPYAKGNHFDSLIIDDQRKCVVLIEAKRLNSVVKLNEIVKDHNQIKVDFIGINLDGKEDYDKYGMLLIDVWVSKKRGENDRRAKLLKELNEKIPYGNDFEQNLVDIGYTEDANDGFNEKYHLAYKLFKL
jgi:hypothetical protein